MPNAPASRNSAPKVASHDIDTKMRSGFIPSDAPYPRRIGTDVAGTVTAVGEGMEYSDGTPVRVGDEVAGRTTGSVAEVVAIGTEVLARRPDGVPPEVAGALQVAGLTAVSCLATVPVGADDVVLVGGASGGVGLVLSQLVRDTGARVIGTASERNHDLLRSHGVEAAVYGADLAERLGGAGITAVFDLHGRDTLDAGVALGVPKDRICGIAAYAAIGELGVVNVERNARTSESLEKLLDQIADGGLTLPIAATFPLDEVVAAFRTLEGDHAPGKVVVVP